MYIYDKPKDPALLKIMEDFKRKWRRCVYSCKTAKQLEVARAWRQRWHKQHEHLFDKQSFNLFNMDLHHECFLLVENEIFWREHRRLTECEESGK